MPFKDSLDLKDVLGHRELELELELELVFSHRWRLCWSTLVPPPWGRPGGRAAEELRTSSRSPSSARPEYAIASSAASTTRLQLLCCSNGIIGVLAAAFCEHRARIGDEHDDRRSCVKRACSMARLNLLEQHRTTSTSTSDAPALAFLRLPLPRCPSPGPHISCAH